MGQTMTGLQSAPAAKRREGATETRFELDARKRHTKTTGLDRFSLSLRIAVSTTPSRTASACTALVQ